MSSYIELASLTGKFDGEQMGLKYAVIHSSIHLLTILFVILFFRLDSVYMLIPLVGGLIIDADHLPLVRRHGIRKAFSMVVTHGFGKIRRYKLHNYVVILASLVFGLLVFFPEYFLIGVFSISLFFHLLWDLVEDAVLFRVKLNHWKL